ncbi:MAG: hypothetical protein ACLP1E_15445 [Acidimicrobiales bacterium]
MQPSDTTIRQSTRLYLTVAGAVSCASVLLLLLAPASGQTTVASRRPSGKTAPIQKNVVTFGTQTASATKPDGRGIYLFGATPGGRIEDHVAIRNYSDQTATFLIRGTDAVNTPQGDFAALPIYERSHDLGAWIALPRSDLKVTLGPRTDLIIPFLVEVPADATPGDHVGVITATLVSSVISKSGQRLRLLQSVGSRIFLRVSGPLHPSLTVTGLAVHYQGPLDPIGTGKVKVTYTVSNRGNVALGGLQTVYISGLFGGRSAARVPQIQLLLPGFSVKETVEVNGVFPEIRETAHVSVRPLYMAGSVAPPSGPFQASLSFWAIPWILIVIIVALILLVVGWFRRRRHRRRARDATAGPQKPGGQDSVGKQESPPGDVPVSNGSRERQAAGYESPAKDPTPLASDERESG